jgi:hypothetical protein
MQATIYTGRARARNAKTNHLSKKTPPLYSRQGRSIVGLCTLLLAGSLFAADPYQQDGGSAGTVSIEVENFDRTTTQGGHSWRAAYPLGASGGGGLEAAPNSGVNHASGFVDNSPRLDYPIKFTRSGTHYVWVRAAGATTSDDSLHVGLNGSPFATSTAMGSFGPELAWNNRLMNGSVAMVNVPSAGEHTLNLWMREDGVVIDKLVLVASSSYRPSGTGPVVSATKEPVVVGNAFPIELLGNAPEQAVVVHKLSKPKGASTATITVSTFDADMADEGELVINDRKPIALFGNLAKSANDDQNVDMTFTTPAWYWRNGDNTLVFRHIRTAGFSINNFSIVFDGEASVESAGVSGGSTVPSAPAPVVESGGSVLMQLTGAAPEQASMTLNVSKPSSASSATISLATFDADMRDEGELIINGNPPVLLFGSAAKSTYDGNAARIELATPVGYWRNGDNNLVFRHTRTGGYIIDNVSVSFGGSVAGASANSLPTLSGTPGSSATVGSNYVFQPTAADADGDKLSFSVSNKPGWASFNSDTGRLSGVPTAAGSASNIRISVSDGKGSVALPAFGINVADAGSGSGGNSVTVEWSPPAAREDGSPLYPSQISGYTVYYGLAPNSFSNSLFVAGGSNTSVTLDNLSAGKTIYIALTASDKDGLQSSYSNVLEVQM